MLKSSGHSGLRTMKNDSASSRTEDRKQMDNTLKHRHQITFGALGFYSKFWFELWRGTELTETESKNGKAYHYLKCRARWDVGPGIQMKTSRMGYGLYWTHH
jgi:hypothetical protein